MLRENGSNKIVGILKPEDGEEYKLKDQHNLIYRKYVPQMTDYEFEMFQATCEGIFHYYPFLSDMDGFIVPKDEPIQEEVAPEDECGKNSVEE